MDEQRFDHEQGSLAGYGRSDSPHTVPQPNPTATLQGKPFAERSESEPFYERGESSQQDFRNVGAESTSDCETVVQCQEHTLEIPSQPYASPSDCSSKTGSPTDIRSGSSSLALASAPTDQWSASLATLVAEFDENIYLDGDTPFYRGSELSLQHTVLFHEVTPLCPSVEDGARRRHTNENGQNNEYGAYVIADALPLAAINSPTLPAHLSHEPLCKHEIGFRAPNTEISAKPSEFVLASTTHGNEIDENHDGASKAVEKQRPLRVFKREDSAKSPWSVYNLRVSSKLVDSAWSLTCSKGPC